MTGEKMSHILYHLTTKKIPLRSVCIDCSGGGEIRLTMPQPDEAVHRYMLDKGFVFLPEADEYIYRP